MSDLGIIVPRTSTVSTCVGTSGWNLKLIELGIEGPSAFERVGPFAFLADAIIAWFLASRTRMEGPRRVVRGAGAPVEFFDAFLRPTMVILDAQ